MGNNNEIHLNFTYTKDDYLQAWRFYRASTWIVKFGKPLAIIVMILFILFILMTSLQPNYIPYYLIFLLFALEAWFDLTGETRCRLYYRSNKHIFEVPYDVTVDETGIHVKSPSLEASSNWTAYSDIMENEHSFLLIRGKGLFATYPKRVFRNDEQINDFRSVATKNILEA
jgi:hypothetical protein